MKQKLVGFGILAFLIVGFVGCSKNRSVEQNKIETLTSKESSIITHLSLTAFNEKVPDADIAILRNVLKNEGSLYKKIEGKIDFQNVTMNECRLENHRTYILPVKGHGESYLLVKGEGLDLYQFHISKELLFTRKISAPNNAVIGILKSDGEALYVDIRNGIGEIKDINEAKYNSEFKFYLTKDCQGNHGGTGFCQRQPGESFGACYQAEAAEFCDSWISCVMLATNPLIPATIATACSCSATLCP